MGAVRKIDIRGAKGGEAKPKNPTEAPDSLRSVAIAKMLIAVGEGEFEGTPTDRDIRLDGTPLQDPQGNMNFPNVKWEWRTGAVDQTYIQGIPSIENETTISTELRSGTPWRSSDQQHSAFCCSSTFRLAGTPVRGCERQYQWLPDRIQGRGSYRRRGLPAGAE